jgi:hypothetical protein
VALIATVAVDRPVSIDKHSTGMPEIDVHRRTTKVNFSIMGGVILFFAVMGALLLWFAHR